MELVSIGRGQKTIELFDTKGGKVTLHTSPSVEQQSAMMKKYGKTDDIEKQTEMAMETIVACFVEWNVGKDGQALACTPESLKMFSQRDFFAMLQACTGRQLLSDSGDFLSPEEVEKKGKSA